MNGAPSSSTPAVASERKSTLPPSVMRHSAVGLLVALGLLFVSAPFVDDLPNGDLIEVVLLTLVMVSAVVAMGGRRRTFIIALLLACPALVGKWANHVQPDLLPAPFFLIAAFVFFGFMVAQLLRFVLRATRVDTNVLCAGIAGYLMLGLLWVPVYEMVGRLNPAAFSLSRGGAAGGTMDGFNAFYFSFITLCTVGYGDITPVSKVAKMLAALEAITGLFYMAVLISRLVAVYSSTQPAEKHDVEDGR